MPHREPNSRRLAPMPRRGMYRIGVALACGTLMWGMHCFAQEAPPAQPTAQNAPAAASVGLQEVVVTATRRAEAESKVPISITAFTQEQMDSQGLRQVDDLTRFTPGLNLTRIGNGGNDVSIRGIASQAGAGTTGIYIDDTPIQVRYIGYSPGSTFPALFDLQRVEVLRGPQGTLFGASSEGGTVRFIQTTPDLEKFQTYDRLEVSNTQFGAPSYEAGVAVGAPIVKDRLAFRVSAYYRRDGGYIDRVTGDFTTLAPGGNLYGQSIAFGITGTPLHNTNWTGVDGFHGSLKFAPNDVLTITPSFSYQMQHVNDNPGGAYWLAISNPKAGVFNYPIYFAGDPATNPAINQINVPTLNEGNDRFYLPALAINANFGPVTLVSNTSYFDRNEHQWFDFTDFYEWLYSIAPSPRPGDKASSLYTNGQQNFTQEVRLQSNNDQARLNWVFGLFFAHDRQQAGQYIAENFMTNAPVIEVTGLPPFLAGLAGGSPFGPGSSAVLNYFGVPLLPGSISWTANIATLDQQEAAFAQGDFKITQQLKLTAGVRVSRDKLSVDGTYGGPENNNYYAYGGPCPVGVNAAGTACIDSYPTTNSGRSQTFTTPKVGIEYQMNDANLFYATAAKGFRPAGASILVPVSQCAQDLQTIGYVDPTIPLAAIKQSDSTQPAIYGADSVWSYEIGSKNRLFDGRAVIDASGYVIKWSNIQSSIVLPLCGYAFADNVGKATAQGFDIGLRGEPIKGLALSGTFGYNKTTFDQDARTPNGVLLYTKGSAVPGTGAPMTLSVSGQYDFMLFGEHDFYVHSDVTHSSTWRPAADTDPTSSAYRPLDRTVPAYSVLNLRVGTLIFNGGDLSLFMNNVTNSFPNLALAQGGAAAGYPAVWTDSTLRPRTYGMTFVYHY